MGEETWVLVASLLIMAAIVGKMLSQHVITRLEKEVGRLEQLRKVTIERLQKVRRRRKSAQGTKAFMERRKADIEQQLGDLRGELQEGDEEGEEGEEGGQEAGGEAGGEADETGEGTEAASEVAEGAAEDESEETEAETAPTGPERDDKEIKVKHRSVRPFE